MSNPNGQRGAKAERDLVVWLRANGYPDAARGRGEGAVDRGDIAGIPNTAVQVKNALRLGYVMARLSAAQRGALEQAHGRRPVAVVRLPGVTDPGSWWAGTPVTWTPGRRLRPGLVYILGGYDLPIDARDVADRCPASKVHAAIGECGGALRGGWWISRVETVFSILRAAS